MVKLSFSERGESPAEVDERFGVVADVPFGATGEDFLTIGDACPLDIVGTSSVVSELFLDDGSLAAQALGEISSPLFGVVKAGEVKSDDLSTFERMGIAMTVRTQGLQVVQQLFTAYPVIGPVVKM